MGVKVTRLKDGATHEFAWRAFRPRTLRLLGNPIEEVELPSSLLVRPEEPHRFNILFNAAAFVAEAGPMVAPVAGLWQQYRDQQLAAHRAPEGTVVELVAARDTVMEIMFQEFFEAGEAMTAWSDGT